MRKEKILRAIKIIVIAIIVLFFIILIKKIINKEEIPFISTNSSYIVLSGSMEPKINRGDIVFIKETNEEDLHVGDIISFSDGGMTVTHRIVEIKSEDGINEYVTKGDNNNIEDNNTVKYKNIIGKYSSKVPRLGYAILFIQQHLIAVISIFIFIIVFMITRQKKEEQ